MPLLRVGVLFGGKSKEHYISILSASSVLKEIDKSKYIPIPIAIKKNGKIASEKETKDMLDDNLKNLVIKSFPYNSFGINPLEKNLIDVIFPVLHGPNGEDGTIQGWLELLGIPYVGSGVLGSSISMDKEIMKRVLDNHSLPILPYHSFLKHHWINNKNQIISEIELKLSYPIFVKPANMGSSLGISKTNNKNQLAKGIEEALKYDVKVLVEQGITPREIEVAILGNENPKASIPGEIIPCKDFYNYEAKYFSNDSKLIIPADLSSSVKEKIKHYSIKTFLALNCSGLARIDFFIDKKNNKIYVNEINTIPGFTNISMYSKLWSATGISYKELIHKLISLGIEKHNNKISIDY